MSQFPNSLPGVGSTTLDLTPRNLFVMATDEGDFLPAGGLIDGYSTRDLGNSAVRTDEIRPGLILGKISTAGAAILTSATAGAYGAAFLGTVSNGMGTATTSATVTASVAAEIVRRSGSSGSLVLTGTGSVSGTVSQQTTAYSAVNTTTGVITITALGTAVKAGALIGVVDGSAAPVTFLTGPYPIRVTDINSTNQITPLPRIPITFKPVDVTNIVLYPTWDSALASWLKTQLRVAVPGMSFSDDF